MVFRALRQDLQTNILFEQGGQGFSIISGNKKYRDEFQHKISPGRDSRAETAGSKFREARSAAGLQKLRIYPAIETAFFWMRPFWIDALVPRGPGLWQNSLYSHVQA
jgi:hypothetical protein